MKKKEEKKWEIIYSWTDDGRVQLTEEEYQEFIKKIEGGSSVVRFKDGRILSNKFTLIRQNPRWMDPLRARKIKKGYELWYEYQELKKRGDFKDNDEVNKFEDWLLWRRK